MRASITTKLRARQHAGATRQTSCSDFFKVFACIFFAHVYALLPAYWHDICNFPFRGTGRDGTEEETEPAIYAAIKGRYLTGRSNALKIIFTGKSWKRLRCWQKMPRLNEAADATGPALDRVPIPADCQPLCQDGLAQQAPNRRRG